MKGDVKLTCRKCGRTYSVKQDRLTIDEACLIREGTKCPASDCPGQGEEGLREVRDASRKAANAAAVDELRNKAPGIRCFRIIRSYRAAYRGPLTIRNNVTLAEAQEHCAKPGTSTEYYFDGYDWMPGCKPLDD